MWDIKSYNPSAKPKTYRKSLHTYTDWNICIDTPLFPVCFRRLGLVDVYGTIILYTSTLGRKLKATYFFLYFVIFFFILFLPKNLNSSIAIKSNIAKKINKQFLCTKYHWTKKSCYIKYFKLNHLTTVCIRCFL